MNALCKTGWMIALLLAGARAAAQNLPDPTRPPATFIAPPAGQVHTAAAMPQLQSILISRAAGGRRVAVIDGQTVLQGGRFRDATVVRIAPNEVELRTGDTRQLLRLYPRPAAQPLSVK
jgi:MSHA biogenesis protein MshK